MLVRTVRTTSARFSGRPSGSASRRSRARRARLQTSRVLVRFVLDLASSRSMSALGSRFRERSTLAHSRLRAQRSEQLSLRIRRSRYSGDSRSDSLKGSLESSVMCAVRGSRRAAARPSPQSTRLPKTGADDRDSVASGPSGATETHSRGGTLRSCLDPSARLNPVRASAQRRLDQVTEVQRRHLAARHDVRSPRPRRWRRSKDRRARGRRGSRTAAAARPLRSTRCRK